MRALCNFSATVGHYCSVCVCTGINWSGLLSKHLNVPVNIHKLHEPSSLFLFRGLSYCKGSTIHENQVPFPLWMTPKAQ